MAKKPPPPSPPASSSEEEESSSDEEQPPATSKPEPQTPAKDKDDEDEEESEDESEEESDDDDEEPGSDSKKPQPSIAAAPAAAPAAALAPAPSKPELESESGSGSESGDDSDSDSEAAKLVTPISSRPMGDGPVPKASDSEAPNGKTLFQRIWTPDDEIAILNAMADFEPKHGPIKMNPNTIGGFLGFVKDSLSTGVTGSQLADKIRRLKKKYSGVAARAKNNEKRLKAHDQAVYELAKKVWGKEEGDDDHKTVANGKANGVVANAGGKRGYPLLKEAVAEIEKKMGNGLVAEALEMIDSEKATVLEKKLKRQKVAEIKHKMHGLDLLKETLKLIVEGVERTMD